MTTYRVNRNSILDAAVDVLVPLAGYTLLAVLWLHHTLSRRGVHDA